MAIQCPRCRRQYDVTLFQFGKRVRCECGAQLDLEQGHLVTIGPEGPPPHTDSDKAPGPSRPCEPPPAG